MSVFLLSDCNFCENFRNLTKKSPFGTLKKRFCLAYPEGIPMEVIYNDKIEGYICNNGVGFEKLAPKIIIKQDILILKNRKYYILDIDEPPHYSSKQVEIDDEIFDYSWAHEQTNGKIKWVISIANEKEYQFEGKNIYFIPNR